MYTILTKLKSEISLNVRKNTRKPHKKGGDPPLISTPPLLFNFNYIYILSVKPNLFSVTPQSRHI